MNSLSDYLDNALDARAISRIDRVRIARLENVRALVWSRLHELNHQIEFYDHQVALPQCGPKSSAAFDNLRNSTATTQAFFSEPDPWLTHAIIEVLPKILSPDPRLIEERKALRRLLRLLNKVITIALRREAFDGSLRKIVFRLRAFFVTHGNHPPRHLLRHRFIPEGCAV